MGVESLYKTQEVTLMLHTNNPVIKHKAGSLNLAEELGNVSKACKVMGVSRDTFYRYRELAEQGGVDALINRSRRSPNLKNRTDAATEQAVIDYAVEFPAHGQHRISNELRKKGIFISGSGVRSIWVRHSLENFKKRLKGVGRIYQQTFVDTYSKVAHCKLYVSKMPITAVDLLNDHVLPFYESQDLPMLRILTDLGTEYFGRVEHHDYQLYLALSDIDHTKTKAMSPQTNGICERFHRTILQEFYQVAFRKKLYGGIDTLQSDLDEWWSIIIMRERIREKCAVGGRRWKHYLMETHLG